MSTIQKEPPCYGCRYCEARQCVKEWPDNSSTGIVKRRIRVEPAAHAFPAHHVHKFWCQGKGFVANGYGPSVDVYGAFAQNLRDAGLIAIINKANAEIQQFCGIQERNEPVMGRIVFRLVTP